MAGESAARLRFDPVLNWGHLLIFGGVIASAVGIYMAGEIRLNVLEIRVKGLEGAADRYIASNEKLTDVLTDLRIEIAAIKVRLPPPQSNATRN